MDTTSWSTSLIPEAPNHDLFDDDFCLFDSNALVTEDLETSFPSWTPCQSQIDPPLFVSPAEICMGHESSQFLPPAASLSLPTYNSFNQTDGLPPFWDADCPVAMEGKRKRHNLQARKVFDCWLENHLGYPYPSTDEKRILAGETGLTEKQVSNYMSNARERLLKKQQQDTASEVVDIDMPSIVDLVNSAESNPESSSFGASPDSSLAQLDSYNSQAVHRLEGLPPLERYLADDIFDEGYITYVHPQGTNPPSCKSPAILPTTQLPTDSFVNLPDLSEISSLSIRSPMSVTSGMSVDSFPSYGSGYSYQSIDSAIGPRRGRRKFKRTEPRLKTSSCMLSCPTCKAQFTSSRAWRRHMKTEHYPEEVWVCMPENHGFYVMNNQRFCFFCQLPWTEGHETQHAISKCMLETYHGGNAPVKTFRRKDSLRAHCLRVHGVAMPEVDLLSWRRALKSGPHICCYCNMEHTNLDSFLDHLKRHVQEEHKPNHAKSYALPPWTATLEEMPPLPVNDGITAGFCSSSESQHYLGG